MDRRRNAPLDPASGRRRWKEMNPFDQLKLDIEHAEHVNRAVKYNATRMAELLRGNLRSVTPCTLVDFKKELKNFNIRTRRWKKS